MIFEYSNINQSLFYSFLEENINYNYNMDIINAASANNVTVEIYLNDNGLITNNFSPNISTIVGGFESMIYDNNINENSVDYLIIGSKDETINFPLGYDVALPISSSWGFETPIKLKDTQTLTFNSNNKGYFFGKMTVINSDNFKITNISALSSNFPVALEATFIETLGSLYDNAETDMSGNYVSLIIDNNQLRPNNINGTYYVVEGTEGDIYTPPEGVNAFIPVNKTDNKLTFGNRVDLEENENVTFNDTTKAIIAGSSSKPEPPFNPSYLEPIRDNNIGIVVDIDIIATSYSETLSELSLDYENPDLKKLADYYGIPEPLDTDTKRNKLSNAIADTLNTYDIEPIPGTGTYPFAIGATGDSITVPQGANAVVRFDNTWSFKDVSAVVEGEQSIFNSSMLFGYINGTILSKTLFY